MSFAQIGLIHALSKGVVQSELLTIILRPEKVNEVLELLDELGVDWMCLSQVEGVGRQRGHTEIFRGREYSIEPKPKVCL
ncbi:MAG: P-II family nitrogen regulator, partial [Candidatus Omnitrophica bacterium]|nr:P-II family nitrogen regulator [Candidatus Omnitrophota bacterium]